MVFVKFHNMKQKKNSNVAFKLKQTQKFSLYKSKQYYNHSAQIFSFLFFSIYVLSISLKKMFVLFFLFFPSICCVQKCSSFLSFPLLSFFHCPVPFSFLFLFSFFFHNKLLIHCHFFFKLISTSLCLYLNTITIGSLPSLFNFSLYFRNIRQVYN